MNEYIEALNSGKEIVIVAENENYLSAIFWKTVAGKIRSFNTEFGIIECNYMDDSAFIEHINLMIDENAIIFIRG